MKQIKQLELETQIIQDHVLDLKRYYHFVECDPIVFEEMMDFLQIEMFTLMLKFCELAKEREVGIEAIEDQITAIQQVILNGRRKSLV